MKQEIPTTESKALSLEQHTPAAATRARVSTTKESSKSRPKLSPSDASNSSLRVRRAILPTKPKNEDEREIGEPKVVDQPRSRTVEQYARVRRRHVDTDNQKGSEYQRKISVSGSMVQELQSEVQDLKAQLERLRSRNALLEEQNKQLGRDLASAEAKIRALEKCNKVELITKEVQASEFKDVQELIANKLNLFPLKQEVGKRDKATNMQSSVLEPGIRAIQIQPEVQSIVRSPPPRAPLVPGPPPPPPPPPRTIPSRANAVRKAPALVEFYHSMTKREGKRGNLGSEKCSSPVVSNAHNSIVDELQNRSAHLLAIKADVEKKGDFINHLIHKVQTSAFGDIEDVPPFVHWLDGQLSTLADERAVLKHFNWPEKKADALREAAFEYRDLKRLLVEVSSFEDEVSLPCEATMKKATTLLDKSERSVQRLIKLRGTTMICYKDYRIPTEWMLDSGMICQIKLACTKLAKVYLKRVSMELKLARHADRESLQEALLLQGVRFAYRTYQFAGGLDAETMRAFEELKERVQLHGRGSRDLLMV